MRNVAINERRKKKRKKKRRRKRNKKKMGYIFVVSVEKRIQSMKESSVQNVATKTKLEKRKKFRSLFSQKFRNSLYFFTLSLLLPFSLFLSRAPFPLFLISQFSTLFFLF